MESSAETIVSLTEAAAKEVQNMVANNPEHTGKTLRVFVEDGGCSGMKYSMIFDEKRDNDFVAEYHGVPILVDNVSAGYLKGTVVDFNDDLNSHGFKIVNPNARQTCGCGRSFEA